MNQIRLSHRIHSINGFRGYISREFSVNCSIMVIDDNTAKIIYLFSSDRGKGNGTKAMEKIMKFLKDLGFSKVLLEVHRNHEMLEKWYSKFGFVTTNTENSGITFMECIYKPIGV